MVCDAVHGVPIGEIRDCDVFVFDAVDAIEVEVECDVGFDDVNSRLVFLVDELLGKRDAIERSQIEEGDLTLAADKSEGEDCIHGD